MKLCENDQSIGKLYANCYVKYILFYFTKGEVIVTEVKIDKAKVILFQIWEREGGVR